MDGTKWTMKKILNDNYKCEGQISLFDIADKPLKFHEAEWLRAHGFKNVYEEPPKAGIYEFTDIENPTKTKQFEVSENGGIKVGGSDFKATWWRPIKGAAKAAASVEDFMNPPEEAAKAAAPICKHSKHTCNKKELWKVADSLDEIQCPHVCCRMCNTRNCGARCNGSEEPRELDPDFPIRDKEGWKPIDERPSRKCIQLELQVLGKYRYNNKDNWSLCPAEYDGEKIIPLEVPFDIPRPDWKYWRVRPDKGTSHDRYGREYKAPTWMDVERCENCKWWQILPPEEQPPAGWGVKGQCNCYHEPEMMKNGYWKTSKTSSCQDFAEKEIVNG